MTDLELQESDFAPIPTGDVEVYVHDIGYVPTHIITYEERAAKRQEASDKLTETLKRFGRGDDNAQTIK